MAASVTYVYCLVAAKRRPALRPVRPGLPGTGPARLLPIETGARPRTSAGRRHSLENLRQWLVVADAPPERYGEAALNRNMSDLDWVARAAVAHEAVVEAYITAVAILPMKLFTIFTSDDRALAQMVADRRQIARLVSRVARRDEWGVRVVLDRDRAIAGAARAPRKPGKPGHMTEKRGGRASGAGYLARKKAARDATARLEQRAKKVVRDVYGALGSQSDDARRRAPSDLAAGGGSLLLDAAFLVSRANAARFRSAVGGQARRLGPAGYQITLSGPWPAYSFLQA